MSQSATKKITLTTTIQRRWDSEKLAAYRARISSDEQCMELHREQRARGQEMWVDCHGETVVWVEDGRIEIGRQRYAVGPVEEGYHLRCTCAGCSRDLAYCWANHHVRIADFTYDRLCRKAKAALLPDGAVIRFSSPFDLGAAGKHDTFRKGHSTHGIRKGGVTRKETSTVFYIPDGRGPYRIINWQCLDWEVVTLSDVGQGEETAMSGLERNTSYPDGQH